MTSELFNYGLKITAIGMGIVFVTLYLMQLLLIALGKIVSSTAKASKIAPMVSSELVDSAESMEAVEIVDEDFTEVAPRPEINFGVMIAISAALAAAMGSRPVNIVSIRRDHGASSLWQQAGRSGNPERQHN